MSKEEQEYAALWQATDKIVFSRTLSEMTAPRTRLEREFDADRIRQLKATADRDISIGGPEIASHALAAGLVDEIHLFLCPIIIGSGNPALPDRFRTELELLHDCRFENGVVHLHYGVIT